MLIVELVDNAHWTNAVTCICLILKTKQKMDL